ncbi:MAG: hypothetical protein PHF37_00810 [Phycisphaerae bacterium]|nr:hypothetical protein [Phycisphaerae bacterium]
MKSIVMVVAILLTSAAVFAAPQPAIVQGDRLWTLDVGYTHPQQIVLHSKKSAPQIYWYIIATVTNNTGQDVPFYSNCELMTDTFQIISAGTNVPTRAFGMIKKRHQSQYPFLEPIEKCDTRILQGQDNAKDIAIIWPDFDPQAKDFKLFIEGLSNETAVIEHPDKVNENGEPLKVFLRKTLELNYSVKGDSSLRSGVRLDFENQQWIMR